MINLGSLSASLGVVVDSFDLLQILLASNAVATQSSVSHLPQ
jgi:hypothetical protein